MLLRRPAPAEAAAAAAVEEYVRSTSFKSSSSHSCHVSNSQVDLMLLHAPQLQRLQLQAPICANDNSSMSHNTLHTNQVVLKVAAAAAARIQSTGSPYSSRSTDSGCSSYCGSHADSLQVRCGLVGRSSFASAPGSPGSPSPTKHWTPGHLQELLLQLLPLRSERCNSSRGGSGINKNSSNGGKPQHCHSSRSRSGGNSRGSGSSSSTATAAAEPGVLQGQRALHRLYAMLAYAHGSQRLTDQLLEAYSCVDIEPAVVESLVSMLGNTTLIDPSTTLDTFGEAAARIICALTADESSIANRDLMGQPHLGLPAALARQLAVPPAAAAAAHELQSGHAIRMCTEAARIVRNLAAYKHSRNQTVLGRTGGLTPGLIKLLIVETAGVGKAIAAEALYNLMFEHAENTQLVGNAGYALHAGLAGLLTVDPDHRMAPRYANKYRLAACKVLYLLAGRPSFKAGIMQHDSLVIPSSLEELAGDTAAAAAGSDFCSIAHAILARLQ